MPDYTSESVLYLERLWPRILRCGSIKILLSARKKSMARQSLHQTEPNKPKNVKRDPIPSRARDATANRAASHTDFLEDRLETRAVLTASEVQTLPAGRPKLNDPHPLL